MAEWTEKSRTSIQKEGLIICKNTNVLVVGLVALVLCS
jgi:hypothetical protein